MTTESRGEITPKVTELSGGRMLIENPDGSNHMRFPSGREVSVPTLAQAEAAVREGESIVRRLHEVRKGKASRVGSRNGNHEDNYLVILFEQSARTI